MSKQHLPYFVLAIAMSFVFNFLLSLLICVYPCATFQKCLNWTGLRHPALTILMEAFHGSYRHKPFYLHSFPAIYLMVKFNNLLIFLSFEFELYHATASFNFMVIILLIAIARPYKNKWHDVTTLMLFSSVCIGHIFFSFNLYINLSIETPAR